MKMMEKMRPLRAARSNFRGSREPLGLPGSASRAPNTPCGICDELQLGPLALLGDQVAFCRRGEAALRTEGEVVERNKARRFVDALGELVEVFHSGDLGTDETEDHGFAFR